MDRKRDFKRTVGTGLNALLLSILVCLLAAPPAFSLTPGLSDDDWTMFQDLYGQAEDVETQLLLATAGGSITAGESIAEEKEGELTREQVVEMISNPLSFLWFAMIQNDTSIWGGDGLDALGEGKKVMNTTIIQPVMSQQLTEHWRMIFRPVIPINSFETPKGFNVVEDQPEPSPYQATVTADFARETGLGDIVLWTAFSKWYKMPLVFGFGPTVMMNTATDKALGTGKWSAGPMALFAYVSEKWIFGAVPQHWWSFAGSDTRNDVNLTDIQYIYRYRLSKETSIGAAPNIRINWDADGSERLQFPIGIGGDTLVYLGRLPVKIGLEYYYFIERPDEFGPIHQIRFVFAPVLPAPAWSRNPIF